MKTFKDTEAEKEGDKVNVIFLILASSDYFGVSGKSRLGTRNGILECCTMYNEMFCKTGI
jgi:hypothetical protein